MLSNQNGQYHPQGNAAFASIELFSDSSRFNVFGELPTSDSTQGLHFDYGLHAIYNGSNRLQLLEYFAEASWQWFHLSVGAKRQLFGLQYQALSAGGLLFSQNARPPPELAVYSDYIPVPFTKNLLEIKGFFSHGWLGNNRYVESPYLHHKNLYARLGAHWPISLEYGFEHTAVWGGRSPVYGPLNEGIDDYLRVLLAANGARIPNEVLNVYGNHLGAQNLRISYHHDKFSLAASWQTIFEDGSGKRMQNIRDGLWGLHFRNKNQRSLISNANLEYLHTRHQSGQFHDVNGLILGGRDNYFNNSVYGDGWTYHDYIIGTPFISSPALTGIQSRGTINNRVLAWHLGINGYLAPELSYRAMISRSSNYGQYGRAFSPAIAQTSWMLELRYQLLQDWALRALVAVDHGHLYDSGLSFLIAIAKSGFF